MRIDCLDHFNVITDRIDETAGFYSAVLGLERRDGPPPFTPQQVQWMYDGEGRAPVHINSTDCPRAYDRAVFPGEPTGAIHHVAFRCTGHAAMIARLGELALEYTPNEVAAIGLRQIFITDPNNIVLELNFWGD